VIECSIRASGVIIRGNNLREKFDLEHNKRVTYSPTIKSFKIRRLNLNRDETVIAKMLLILERNVIKN